MPNPLKELFVNNKDILRIEISPRTSTYFEGELSQWKATPIAFSTSIEGPKEIYWEINKKGVTSVREKLISVRRYGGEVRSEDGTTLDPAKVGDLLFMHELDLAKMNLAQQTKVLVIPEVIFRQDEEIKKLKRVAEFLGIS